MRAVRFSLLVVLGLLSSASAASRHLIRVSASNNAASDECASSRLASKYYCDMEALQTFAACCQYGLTLPKGVRLISVCKTVCSSVLPFSALQGSCTGQCEYEYGVAA